MPPIYESVLTNRKQKHNIISLPNQTVTKVTQPKFKTPDGLNPGVSLYERSQITRKCNDEKYRELNKLKNEKLDKECTFTP